jgi:alkanesulfonate monooxygenase SsuD/methylene tetrahydromethanopterin reductase-like flavin-dependent oxidoreductase (luciferase family)
MNVKVTYIQQFPYRHLRDDFRAKYQESVVTNPYFEITDPNLVQADLRSGLDEAMHAARAGFDAVAFTEHGQSSYDMHPNPDLGAAALAYATEVENLPTAIFIVGRTLGKVREPLRVAEELAWLDTLSGGRLIAGFPIGLAYDANINAGIVPIETRARYDENLELILKAWTSREPFAWNGQYSQYMHVNVWPRPFQGPHPPVNVTGTGNPNTTRFALERDFGFNLVVVGDHVSGAQRVFDDLWRMADQIGVDDNPYRANFSQFILVAETDAKAEEIYARHVAYSFANGLGAIPFHRFALPGGISPPGLRVLLKQAGAAAPRTEQPSFKSLVESGAIIAGSPATVRDRILDVARRFRFGNLLAFFQIGSLPTDLVKKNIDLFAAEVMPHLRTTWAEYDASNRWWPARLGGLRPSPLQASSKGARLS